MGCGGLLVAQGDQRIGFGGDSGPATSATLNTPFDVAVDSSGNIHIADTNNDVIREVTASSGIIATMAGIADIPDYSGDNGKALSALLNFPQGVTLDSFGNVYIADIGNSVITKVSH